MKRLTILTCLCCFLSFMVTAQPGSGGIGARPGNSGIAEQARDAVLLMPGVGAQVDSLTRVAVVRCLEGWLHGREDPKAYNAYSGADDPLAEKLLLQELWILNRDLLSTDSLSGYRCYVTSLNALDSAHLLVQFSYMGMRDRLPRLAASYSVLAGRKGDRWAIFSPLAKNTAGWKREQIGCCTFHYKTALNAEKAAAFSKQVAYDDAKVKAGPVAVDFYCCDDYIEAMHIAGEEYRVDYSGYPYQDQDISDSAHTLWVSGQLSTDHFNYWDPHDLWHDRLHRVMSTKIINRAVDEGCAYYFGGSWGKSWTEVLQMIEDYAQAHPDADWLSLYRSGANLVPPPRVVKISYAINALIARRLDREGRFPAMMELLGCGRQQAGDANYFAALRKVTGVDTAGFNRYIWGLVREGEKISLKVGNNNEKNSPGALVLLPNQKRIDESDHFEQFWGGRGATAS